MTMAIINEWLINGIQPDFSPFTRQQFELVWA